MVMVMVMTQVDNVLGWCGEEGGAERRAPVE
jgi:hypothetical protein